MATVVSGMMIDTVDSNDRPVGVLQRNEVFLKHANFRVAHDLIFNFKDELLIQQIAHTRNRHPGYWGSSVAAYVFAGESYEAAANRRIAEELGLPDVKLRYIGKTSMTDEGCLKFIAVFAGRSEGLFTFDHSHIERLEFLPISTIQKLRDSGARLFTPTFLQVLSFAENKI